MTFYATLYKAIDFLDRAIASNTGSVPVVDLSEDVWVRTMAVNATGTFLMCKAMARQMIKQGFPGSKIINMSSRSGKMAKAGASAYGASKFAIIGLTQALALELAPYKINVNAICPSSVVTWGTNGKAIWENI